MRWNKRYDGTKESLIYKSQKPHSQHPNAQTSEELLYNLLRWLSRSMDTNQNYTKR